MSKRLDTDTMSAVITEWNEISDELTDAEKNAWVDAKAKSLGVEVAQLAAKMLGV